METGDGIGESHLGDSLSPEGKMGMCEWDVVPLAHPQPPFVRDCNYSGGANAITLGEVYALFKAESLTAFGCAGHGVKPQATAFSN